MASAALTTPASSLVGVGVVHPIKEEEREKEKRIYSPDREVFIFTYKKGHAVISCHFQSNSLRDAVCEAKEVCRVKKWTWIGVTPFLRDIKKMAEAEDS